MKTILILAGRSRRFWPLGHKPLFPLCGKTLVAHQVDRLAAGGCTDLVLVASPENRDAIASLYPDTPLVIQEGEENGMHRALLAALPLCARDPVLVVSGNDVVEPAAYAALKKAAAKKGVAGVLLASKVTRYFPGGYLTVEDGRITGIVEKPEPGKEPSDLVNIVAHIHNDASVLLAALKKTRSSADDVYERALVSLLKTHDYRAVPYAGAWQAVKYPWHLLDLLEMLLKDLSKKSVHKTASIHPSAVVEGNVVIEENVRILPHATVVGPCHIGAGTIIGNNALVRGSSVGPGCVIGFGSEVKGSALAGPVWTHMTYLGDSVVGENVSFGGGCMTGNLRLDEGEIASVCGGKPVPTGRTKLGAMVGDGCRFGIQVGINPGVKVGADCFVGGGLTLATDVPDESFVLLRDGKIEVKKNKTRAPDMSSRKQYFR